MNRVSKVGKCFGACLADEKDLCRCMLWRQSMGLKADETLQFADEDHVVVYYLVIYCLVVDC